MKKILVLVDVVRPNKKKLVKFLNKNSKGLYKAVLCPFSDLFFEIKTGKVKIKAKGIDLSKYDLVFVRRAGRYVRFMGAISKYLDYKNVLFIDPAFREIGMSMDKASSALRLALKKIVMPDTYFCFRSAVLNNKEKIVKNLGFPIIAKAINSQRNKNIFILKDVKDFEKLLKRSNTRSHSGKEFIFQKFIDIEREFRLLVMGGKVVVLEQKSVRNYKKIKVEYLDPDEPSVFLKLDSVCESINKMALKSTKALNLDVAGVDVAIEKGTGKNYLIEVNKGPGIVPDAKTSPELKAFSDYLQQKIRLI
jgi:glutathione synthase/RimK-type ligase-like ATP-grasp enzyme